MDNPTLTLSQFVMANKRAVVKETYVAKVFGDDDYHTMGNELRDRVAHQRKHNQKFFYTFTRYKRNHSKDNIVDCTAIMLEYPFRMKDDLKKNLCNLPWVHYLVDTEDKDETESRVLVAFPVTTPITRPKDYTRVASLLWDQIGLEAHTRGDISATFFFRMHHTSAVEFVAEDRIVLDAQTFLSIHTGQWVDARHYEEQSLVVDDPRNTHFDEATGELFVFPDAPTNEVRP